MRRIQTESANFLWKSFEGILMLYRRAAGFNWEMSPSLTHGQLLRRVASGDETSPPRSLGQGRGRLVPGSREMIPQLQYIWDPVCSWMREGHGGSAFLATVVRAAPGPLRRQRHQGRLDRVILNVPDDAPEMCFIADVAVEVIVFPECSLAAQNLI